MITKVVLLEVGHEHKSAIQADPQTLGPVLDLSIPEGWPEFPEAFGPSEPERPVNTTWPGYFFMLPEEGALVGNGGFVGPPDAAGLVEIGYEIAPSFRNRGLATAAVVAMIQYAFSHDEVRAVVAHTLAEKNASNAVLKKAGMMFIAELPNSEVGHVWLWRKDRAG